LDAFGVLTLLIGKQEGRPTCRNQSVGMLVVVVVIVIEADR